MLKLAMRWFFRKKQKASSVQTSLDSYLKKPWPVWLRQESASKGRYHGGAFILRTCIYICDKSLYEHLSGFTCLSLTVAVTGGTSIMWGGFLGMETSVQIVLIGNKDLMVDGFERLSSRNRFGYKSGVTWNKTLMRGDWAGCLGLFLDMLPKKESRHPGCRGAHRGVHLPGAADWSGASQSCVMFMYPHPQHGRKSEKDRRWDKPLRVSVTIVKKKFWWIFPQDSFQTSQNSKSLIHIYLYRWPLEASYLWVFHSLNLLFNRVLLMFNNPPNNHRVKRIHFYLVNVSRTFKRLPWTGRGRGLVSFKYGRQDREREK